MAKLLFFIDKKNRIDKAVEMCLLLNNDRVTKPAQYVDG